MIMYRIISESSNLVLNVSLSPSILHFSKISISLSCQSHDPYCNMPQSDTQLISFFNFNNEVKRSKLSANGILKVSVLA